MAYDLLLSLRCRSLWNGPRPADPQEFLERLPAELAELRRSGASLVEFKTEVCALDRRYRDARVWAQAADRADVGICLDVGHVVSNGENLVDAFQLVTARLRGIHLHDATPPAAPGGKGKAHLPIGAGILDLNILFAALAERRFSGPVVLEVKSEFSESTARVLDIVQSISGGQSH